jgi:hypothetical protein
MTVRLARPTPKQIGALLGAVAVIASVVTVIIGGVIGVVIVIAGAILAGSSTMVALAIRRDNRRGQ